MATTTEILRPNEAETGGWIVFPSVIRFDDEVQDPDAGDGSVVVITSVDNGREQVFRFADPAATTYERVSSIAIKLYATPSIANDPISLRLRVGGAWGAAQALSLNVATASWYTVTFSEGFMRANLDTLAVGITPNANNLIIIDVLYAELTGELVSPDFRGDFSDVTDLLEPVTLKDRRGNTLDSIPAAKRLSLSTREAAASGGQYRQGDTTWHLPVDSVTAPPQLGQKIIDSFGDNYTILGIDRIVLDSRYRCISRNLTIAEGLDQLITIQRATWTKGRSGALAATWSDWRTGIAARIQAITSRVETRHELKHTRVTHQIFLSEPIAVDQNTRVIGPDGAVYDVVRYEKPDRIDKLPLIEAQQSPWPRT